MSTRYEGNSAGIAVGFLLRFRTLKGAISTATAFEVELRPTVSI